METVMGVQDREQVRNCSPEPGSTQQVPRFPPGEL